MSEPIGKRSVDNVIKQLLTVIPEKETNLIYDIKNYYDTLWNQAPELLKSKQCWEPLGNILNNNIQNIDEEWKVKLVKIYNGELKVDIILEDLCKKVFHPDNEGRLWNIDEND